MRMPEPDKFNKEELAKIAFTPWDMHVPREMEVVFKDKSEGQGDVEPSGLHQGVRPRAIRDDTRVSEMRSSTAIWTRPYYVAALSSVQSKDHGGDREDPTRPSENCKCQRTIG